MKKLLDIELERSGFILANEYYTKARIKNFDHFVDLYKQALANDVAPVLWHKGEDGEEDVSCLNPEVFGDFAFEYECCDDNKKDDDWKKIKIGDVVEFIGELNNHSSCTEFYPPKGTFGRVLDVDNYDAFVEWPKNVVAYNNSDNGYCWYCTLEELKKIEDGVTD